MRPRPSGVDLQCPFCAQFDSEAMPELIERYVRPGTARVELRILAFIGPDSERGRCAGIAAGRQDRMFDFVHLLFFNQGRESSGWLDEAFVTELAASIPGLNVPRLLEARDDEPVKQQAARFDALAAQDGVTGTPTILVGETGGDLARVQLRSPTDAAAVGPRSSTLPSAEAAGGPAEKLIERSPL
jgi:protein-disulfide isomerase